MTSAQKKFELVRILVDDYADAIDGLTNVQVVELMTRIEALCIEVAMEATLTNTYSVGEWYKKIVEVA